MAGVARPAAFDRVGFVTEMVIELDVQPGLQDVRHQRRQQPALTGQRDPSLRARSTSRRAISANAGSSPGNTAGSREPRSLLFDMDMILSHPGPSGQSVQITPVTQNSWQTLDDSHCGMQHAQVGRLHVQVCSSSETSLYERASSPVNPNDPFRRNRP
jgi:hypothetical protein